MDTPLPGFEFEQPIFDLMLRVRELEQSADKSAETADRLRQLRRELAEVTRAIYGRLTPWQTVQVSRHKDRPHTIDYLALTCDEFVELHGDKHFGDDRAILTGFAKIDQFKVMIVGHEKGRTYKERSACYFGCAHPEGYRKAMGKMRMAAKFGLPVVCFIDTPGAYPGIGAEERGQAQVIAENMYEMSRLPTRSSARKGARGSCGRATSMPRRLPRRCVLSPAICCGWELSTRSFPSRWAALTAITIRSRSVSRCTCSARSGN
jgi:acetyl-CoA carboxylase carboxyl transferase subunit alpha